MSKKIINKQIKLALILAIPIIILLVTKWQIKENILPKIADKDNLPTLAHVSQCRPQGYEQQQSQPVRHRPYSGLPAPPACRDTSPLPSTSPPFASQPTPGSAVETPRLRDCGECPR